MMPRGMWQHVVLNHAERIRACTHDHLAPIAGSVVGCGWQESMRSKFFEPTEHVKSKALCGSHHRVGFL